MRLWSIHPKYLDTAGLNACWRESLLAKKVLQGRTKGYKNHPQLIRFKNCENPVHAIDAYLSRIWSEAFGRGYKYDLNKIGTYNESGVFNFLSFIPVSDSQIAYEACLLNKKIKERSGKSPAEIKVMDTIILNSVFKIYHGEIEPWEKI